MSTLILKPSTYSAGSLQDRRTKSNNTGDYFSLRSNDSMLSPPARGAMSPSYDEDFPTPRANQQYTPTQVANDRQSFDDLYDMTDDESDVPLFASSSVKRTRNSTASSLAIPSPSAWPTIEKLQKDGRLPNYPLSPPIVSPSARSLYKVTSGNLRVPSRSSTPSLDGSLTSEELSSLSCPSTPDINGQRAAEDEWGVQLKSEAMQTLRRINPDRLNPEPASAVNAVKSEMTESLPSPFKIGLTVTPVDKNDDDEYEPISAISVPSPGGFFASLDDSARNTWSTSSEDAPPATSTAESFYGVPWKSPTESTRTIEQVLQASENNTDGPPTARRLQSPSSAELASPRTDDESYYAVDYDENYMQTLQETAAANIDRTSLWLNAQESYISGLVSPPIESIISPTTVSSDNSSIKSPSSLKSPSTAVTSPSVASIKSPGKAVRWADESPVKIIAEKALPPSPREQTFVEGFKHLRELRQKSDAIVQRRARVEALRLDRNCLTKAHRDQLAGKFELDSPVRPKNSRPVSEFYPAEEQDEKNEMIDRVQKERRALEQLKPVSWNLEATKMLNGGTLLTSPAGKTLFSAHEARVLDLGGQASCDWAWEVALTYRKATVHTVYTADQAPNGKVKLEGPNNHKHTVVPNLWTLPFPSNHFDIVSARSLYALLKTTKPAGTADDEYDLCLKECLRVLKPNGYLEFALLDADILRPGSKAQALSVEFGFNLKTRGYDAQPTKAFLPRLKRAGFGQMKRAWLALPMARRESEGSTAEASQLSGMIGAWAWEKWLLKMAVETGKDEERLLAQVAGAMDEGAECGAAWRYLSGWARKA